jgi:hypothetical protein
MSRYRFIMAASAYVSALAVIQFLMPKWEPKEMDR